jgi:hypothetical protein
MLEPFDEIKRIYFATTPQTIEADLRRALDLLKQMPTDEDRQRAAGLMHGLADLRREWQPRLRPGSAKKTVSRGRGQAPDRAGSKRR